MQANAEIYHPSEEAGKPASFTANLSKEQIRRGWLLVLVFLILRAVISRLWGAWFQMSYHLTLPFLAFLLFVFLLVSVGVVYFGFRCWVGVDVKSWWVRPGRIGSDIKSGILALLSGGIVFLAISLGLYSVNLIPVELMAAPAADEPLVQTLAQIPVDLILGWFFGFGVAAFTEETIFRGFIQGILLEETQPWPANLLQALLFAISHIGMMPFVSLGNEVFSLVFRFASGCLFGWLRNKRGSLLPGGIVHGFIG